MKWTPTCSTSWTGSPGRTSSKWSSPGCGHPSPIAATHPRPASGPAVDFMDQFRTKFTGKKLKGMCVN
jgi:hypothetical protein